MEIDRVALEEWQRHQPLAILQLDPSDRVVLRVAGKTYFSSKIKVVNSNLYWETYSWHPKKFYKHENLLRYNFRLGYSICFVMYCPIIYVLKIDLEP